MPWGLGGGPDTIARKVASYGEKYLGQPVIVENKCGGAGTIAMDALMQAPDDGYTMVCSNGPLFSLTPAFVPVDYTLKDITPLIGMRIVEFVILSNPSSSGIHTLEELIAAGKSGKHIKYATTGGPGNDSYTMISVLFKKLGIEAEAVPYDGGQDAINALVGGHVDIAIGSPPVYRDYVRNGQLACLGTFIPEGIEVEGIGKIPSFKEQGIDTEFTGMDYFAVKNSVPEDRKAILTKYVKDVYADPEFQAFMESLGMQAWDATEDEIKEKITLQTEAMDKYIKLIK
jgi:tripartite-type tricarboxylate transporter receptor subunit TctC